MDPISKKAQQTRIYRRLHKWFSMVFIVFLVLIAVTAILLAWKKQWNLVPKTQQSKTEMTGSWIPVEEMIAVGQAYVRDSLGKSTELDRVDIRPDKGIAKIVFKWHFTEVQVDGFSGEILSISQRNSDLIEKIHDGSILDFVAGSDGEKAKLTYSTLTSGALLLLAFTGFFLWYWPRVMKRLKQRRVR
ncbi:PepSY-associated TM helix domain-containing protein [Mariniradius sediminis]|uniref:PepSY domain-containing protein n=1 Tax=Mariniradius sediminis TaxID=2909237 RepID=A0ABS9BQ81_9BACT|nr:PepSY-associated TM helix domain-containing protein [Mariniradius sediminis]MCF1750204.1 PepSY domain-containing protein [Mariniradius sediminis]